MEDMRCRHGLRIAQHRPVIHVWHHHVRGDGGVYSGHHTKPARQSHRRSPGTGTIVDGKAIMQARPEGHNSMGNVC